MNLPGFTAEASLYQTDAKYRSAGAFTAAGETVRLAQFEPPVGDGDISGCAEACFQDFGDNPRRLRRCLLGCRQQ
jgi:hypothetical protein